MAVSETHAATVRAGLASMALSITSIAVFVVGMQGIALVTALVAFFVGVVGLALREDTRRQEMSLPLLAVMASGCCATYYFFS